MDPAPAAEVAGERKERKKIKFTVPPIISSQLDPRQVEMIRRRRPTPAMLFRVADPSPEDDNATHQVVVGENGTMKPKRVNQSVYQPPSLKAVQRMAQAHMGALGAYPTLEDPPEGEEYEEDLSLEEEDSLVSGSQSEVMRRPEVTEDESKEDEKDGKGRGE